MQYCFKALKQELQKSFSCFGVSCSLNISAGGGGVTSGGMSKWMAVWFA